MGPRSLARTGGAAARRAADLRVGGGSPLRLAPARVVCRRSRSVVRDRLLARTAPRRLREPPLGRRHPALVAGLHRRDTPRGPENRRPARTKRPARTCEAGSRLNTHHNTTERTRRSRTYWLTFNGQSATNGSRTPTSLTKLPLGVMRGQNDPLQ